jgi:hypothetical protein
VKSLNYANIGSRPAWRPLFEELPEMVFDATPPPRLFVLSYTYLAKPPPDIAKPERHRHEDSLFPSFSSAVSANIIMILSLFQYAQNYSLV